MEPRAVFRVAQLIQSEVDSIGLGSHVRAEPPSRGDLLGRYDSIISSDQLQTATRRLFSDGHYARAVEEAYKCLNNAVKDKSRISSKDGADLMREAFSANVPILKLNDFRSQSHQDEQRGYMDIYAGSMMGIRNPRAHDHQLDDQPAVALELLTLANHLMRRLDGASRSRRPRSRRG